MGLKEKIITYFDETVIEMKKVTWPSKDEVRGSTVVVIITSIILAAFTFGVDSTLSWITRTLLGA